MKALVVDDSRAMRMILTQMLKECGFEVVEAKHGKEALVCLESNPDTSLALIDWNMPEMNGLEFVEAARARPEGASMLIMMVTTEIESAQMVRALEAGQDAESVTIGHVEASGQDRPGEEQGEHLAEADRLHPGHPL